jgi:hypothetical protein
METVPDAHCTAARAIGSILVFSILVDVLGVLLAGSAAFLVIATMQPALSPLGAAAQVGIFATLIWLIFIFGLGIDLPLRPAL